MRIRKLAARLILGVPTSPSRPSSPPRSSTMDPYVCQLNQSMWDIYAYPPSPSPSATNDYASISGDLEELEESFIQDENNIEKEEVNREKSMYTMASQKNESYINVEESMFSMASQKDELDINADESLYSMVLRQKDEINKDYEKYTDVKDEINKDYEKYTDVRTGKMNKRKRAEKYMDMEVDQTAPIVAAKTCNRTDGKNWNCKRPAYHPHKLCLHHLRQNQAYGSGATMCNVNKESAIAVANNRPAKGTIIPAKLFGSNSDYYYYYSGFGPWRGKQRGICKGPSTAVIQEKEEEEKEETEIGINYQGNKLVGNEEKKRGKQISTPNTNKRKKGKVRSLKSFSNSY